MKKAFLQTLLCLPLLGLGLQAQAQNTPHVCGTTIQEQAAIKERLTLNRANSAELMERLNIRRNNGIIYIPIQFHMVGKTDGTGYLSLDNLWANMCRLNTDYADQDIQFYLYDTPTFIANDALYYNNKEDRSLASYLMNIYKKPEAVNVFIGDVIGSIGNSGGITLGYYTAFPDVIYCIKSTINGGSKTLTHELGHLFTLAHTFYGWEGLSYSDEVAANNGTTPTQNSMGSLVEKVARDGGTENCQAAADGFCDTYPDYNFGLSAPGCQINFDAYDPDGVLLARSSASDNFMSYFNDNCTNTFSTEQKNAILLDVVSRGYDRLDIPTESAITETVNIVWPTATAPTTHALSEIKWNSVNNATMYSVSINRTFNGTFVSRVNEWVTRDTSLWVTLPSGSNLEYTLTVRPINHLDFCNVNAVSATTRFNNLDWTVGVDRNIEAITSSKVYPNPSNRQAPVMVEFNSTDITDVTISVLNTLGQSMIGRQTITLAPGTSIESLDMSMLPAGMYFINVESTQGRITHKLMLN